MTLQFDPGARWQVTLSDPATGRDLLAAVTGGPSPLRVLVPAGRWAVRAESAGATRDLGTRAFAVTGPARKQGWRFDLRGEGAAAHPFALCQGSVAVTQPTDRVGPPQAAAARSRLLREPAPGELSRTLDDLADPPSLLPIAPPTDRRLTLPCD
ncbi:hypothetical protein V8J36_07915 [Frigidibacter sp. MR17.14]|uniref:hypothetical protein n=1 Tax=Frigidibacter sp. MR17.14 TaxID=3126509 RepID=UPI003012DEAD